MNRKWIAIFLAAVMLLSLSVPALAEDDRPLSERKDLQYVTTIFQHPPKDEKYWEKEFELNKELPPLEEYAPSVPISDPTPEDIEKWNQMAKEKLEEDKAWDEQRLQDEEQRRSNMLGAVIGDNLHEVNVPETTFQGDYQEFDGQNGSVTRIYEDGSMETSYPDGSWEGMDSMGNHAVEDKDGNRTVELLNGDKATYKDDGSVVVQQTDNATVTYRPDGTASWTNASGLVVDYNADGERTAIGFEGGEKTNLVYGQLPPGDSKIGGPNGAFIEWHNGQTSELQNDGTSDVVVNGDGNYGFSIKGTDGSTGRLEIDREYDPRIDEQGTIDAKKQTNGNSGTQYTTDTKYSISSMDGSAIEIVQDNNHSGNVTVRMEDADGNVHLDRSYENGFVEKSYESADGKVKFEYKLDENGVSSYYEDENGRQQLVDTVVNDDGTVSIVVDYGEDVKGELKFYEDGSVCMELPDGQKISADKNGNVTEIVRDGESFTFDDEGNLLDRDGNIVKGAQDDEGFDDPDKQAQPMTPFSDGLSIEAVSGVYHNVGGSGYIDIDANWKEVWKDVPDDATVTVFDAGNGCISFTVSVTGKSLPEPMSYDASTGTGRLEYKEEGIAPFVYTITFSDLGGGKISMHINSDWAGDTWLDFYGQKE